VRASEIDVAEKNFARERSEREIFDIRASEMSKKLKIQGVLRASEASAKFFDVFSCFFEVFWAARE